MLIFYKVNKFFFFNFVQFVLLICLFQSIFASKCLGYYNVQNISSIGFNSLQNLQNKNKWYIELGDQFLTISQTQNPKFPVCADPSLLVVIRHKLRGDENIL